jgi:hypothetical protein
MPDNTVSSSQLIFVSTDNYPIHLPNDTLSIAFENTVFLLIPKENATVSIDSVLKWRARSHSHYQ